MEPRVSFITLGVGDVATARAFYERLGFSASPANQNGVAFFDAGGIVLALFGRAELAHDANVNNSTAGFSGVALAHSVGSAAGVDVVLSQAVAAGARLLKAGQKAFWGGYSGYFADPDGHVWEVAFNPFMPLDASGRVTLQGPAA